MEMSGELHMPAALTPRKKLSLPIAYEAESAPYKVCTLCSGETFLALAENRTRVLQSIATQSELSRLLKADRITQN